jgi:hypothetical protein
MVLAPIAVLSLTPAALSLIAALVAAALLALAAVIRAVLRRRRGPPPLARLLLAGSLHASSQPGARHSTSPRR